MGRKSRVEVPRHLHISRMAAVHSPSPCSWGACQYLKFVSSQGNSTGPEPLTTLPGRLEHLPRPNEFFERDQVSRSERRCVDGLLPCSLDIDIASFRLERIAAAERLHQVSF